MRRVINLSLLLAGILPCSSPAQSESLLSAHYSPLTEINTRNVATLRRAWTYHTGELDRGESPEAFEATPLEVNGVMYFTTPSNRADCPGRRDGQGTLGVRDRGRWRRTPERPRRLGRDRGVRTALRASESATRCVETVTRCTLHHGIVRHDPDPLPSSVSLATACPVGAQANGWRTPRPNTQNGGPDVNPGPPVAGNCEL